MAVETANCPNMAGRYSPLTHNRLESYCRVDPEKRSKSQKGLVCSLSDMAECARLASQSTLNQKSSTPGKHAEDGVVRSDTDR